MLFIVITFIVTDEFFAKPKARGELARMEKSRLFLLVQHD
jgi:hypothetical protein